MNGKNCCSPARQGRAANAPAADAPAAAPLSGPGDARDLIALEGADFLMGDSKGEGFPADGEGPVRRVRVEPFGIAATTVTNAQFIACVSATGDITQAEEA